MSDMPEIIWAWKNIGDNACGWRAVEDIDFADVLVMRYVRADIGDFYALWQKASMGVLDLQEENKKLQLEIGRLFLEKEGCRQQINACILTNERLRRVIAHIPSTVFLKAKEAAGYGDQILTRQEALDELVKESEAMGLYKTEERGG